MSLRAGFFGQDAHLWVGGFEVDGGSVVATSYLVVGSIDATAIFLRASLSCAGVPSGSSNCMTRSICAALVINIAGMFSAMISPNTCFNGAMFS